MATHTDTKGLQKYQANSYPNIPGGEARYFTNELRNIANALNQIVDVMKLLEARMNTNGLT
jgi:hypothetical protein